MKKIILVLAFVFTTGTMVNANSSVNEPIGIEDCRACVDLALGVTEDMAEIFGEDIRGENQGEYLALYMEIYTECVNQGNVC